MYTSGELVDHREFLPRSHHGNLILPIVEGSSQKDVLTSMGPGENHGNAVVPCIIRGATRRSAGVRSRSRWKAGSSEAARHWQSCA
eukprot:Skav218704  [mRNA]  locus=scaffold1346:411730:417609:+ [translate_table: standard]